MDKSSSNIKSWKSFPIPSEIIKALKENDLKTPLPIQVRALKAFANDKHVFGAAQTGSGKTLAYTIPILCTILKNRDNPSKKLKMKITNHNRKHEDFELVEGEMMKIEDMIVDRISDDEGDGQSDECASEASEDEAEGESDTCPEAIILVPTRELAIQVKDEFNKIAKYCSVKCCCIIGGLSQDKQIRLLKKHKPEIIIATPGRLYDIVKSDTVQHINICSVASIRTLVIDEADRMVQKGHFVEMLNIIDIIKESTKFRDESCKFRVYLYSATLTFIHELPERFKTAAIDNKDSKRSKKSKTILDQQQNGPTKKGKIKQMLSLFGIEREDTRIIDLNEANSHGKPSADQLQEYKINCLDQEKDLYLYYFLITNRKRRTLIFCNSKTCLRRLSNILKYLGLNVQKLYADMDQKKRLASLEKFRQHEDCIMIATDVAARGLDIKNLDCVVHYQVPRTCESYIHRSGRTARLDRNGISLTLCAPKEIHHYKKLCSNINSGKEFCDYDVDSNLKKRLKDSISLAQQCDKLDYHLRDSKADRSWFTKAAKECEIELDDEDMRRLSGKGRSKEQVNESEAINRRKLAHLHKSLNKMLKRPILHKGMKLN